MQYEYVPTAIADSNIEQCQRPILEPGKGKFVIE
jgi:hypothetical protein